MQLCLDTIKLFTYVFNMLMVGISFSWDGLLIWTINITFRIQYYLKSHNILM